MTVCFMLLAIMHDVSFLLVSFNNRKSFQLTWTTIQSFDCLRVCDRRVGLQVSATGIPNVKDDITCLQVELQALVEIVAQLVDRVSQLEEGTYV